MLFPFLRSLPGPGHLGLPQLLAEMVYFGMGPPSPVPGKRWLIARPPTTHLPVEPGWLLPRDHLPQKAAEGFIFVQGWKAQQGSASHFPEMLPGVRGGVQSLRHWLVPGCSEAVGMSHLLLPEDALYRNMSEQAPPSWSRGNFTRKVTAEPRCQTRSSCRSSGGHAAGVAGRSCSHVARLGPAHLALSRLTWAQGKAGSENWEPSETRGIVWL